MHQKDAEKYCVGSFYSFSTSTLLCTTVFSPERIKNGCYWFGPIICVSSVKTYLVELKSGGGDQNIVKLCVKIARKHGYTIPEEKIRDKVREDLKRKASDSEGACNSPKRHPQDTPLNFSKDTPEWAKILFTQLEAKLIDMESNLAESLEFATKTAIDAATEVGVLKAHIKKHSNEMEDIKYQLAKVNSDHKALQAKVIKLEDHSRRDNLLFFGFNEAQNETDQDCRSKIYDLLRTVLPLQPHVLDVMKIVRCHRKGKYIPGRTRPIIIKFHFFGDRQQILINSGALRGTGIYINEDFSTETEASRKTLYPIVKAAREKLSIRVRSPYM